MFRINNDCSVEYKGSYGDALIYDVFTGLKKNHNNLYGARVYPNPVKDKLNVSFASAFPDAVELLMFNALGQLVYKQGSINKDNEIDISFLPYGIYSLCLKSGDGQKNFKFVKE